MADHSDIGDSYLASKGQVDDETTRPWTSGKHCDDGSENALLVVQPTAIEDPCSDILINSASPHQDVSSPRKDEVLSVQDVTSDRESDIN